LGRRREVGTKKRKSDVCDGARKGKER